MTTDIEKDTTFKKSEFNHHCPLFLGHHHFFSAKNKKTLEKPPQKYDDVHFYGATAQQQTWNKNSGPLEDWQVWPLPRAMNS